MNYARECEDWMDCGGLLSYNLNFKYGVIRKYRRCREVLYCGECLTLGQAD